MVTVISLLLCLVLLIVALYYRQHCIQVKLGNAAKEAEARKIQIEIDELSQQKIKLLQDIENKRKECEEVYQKEKDKISEQIQIYKEDTSYAASQYVSTLEQQYERAERDHDRRMGDLDHLEEAQEKRIQSLTDQITNLQNTLDAGARAQLREREKEEKLDFYKLSISSNDLDDIQKLESIKPMLHQPVILSKLIWTTYFQKQTNDLCNRILKTTDKVCGIYKITDLKTQQYYIGQSVDIATRWKDHIKCGLGIDAPSTNKLYQAMQKDGVWNFTFELMETCERSELDEKEKFWINMYSSRDYGLNETRGNNK